MIGTNQRIFEVHETQRVQNHPAFSKGFLALCPCFQKVAFLQDVIPQNTGNLQTIITIILIILMIIIITIVLIYRAVYNNVPMPFISVLLTSPNSS